MNKSALFDCAQGNQKDPVCRQAGFASFILIIIIGVIVVGVIVASKKETTQTGQTQQSKKSEQTPSGNINFDNEISIQTPNGWQLKENNNPDTRATFFSPKEGKDDKFVENVNLQISNLSSKPDITLDEVATAWIVSGQSDYPDSFELITKEKTTLSGREAIKIMVKASDKISSLKSMVVLALKNNRSYVLNYSAEEKSFDKFLPDFQKLLDSVKFENLKIEWEEFKSEQYGYSLKYPKGWVFKDQSGKNKREVLIVHPQNLANALIAAQKDDSLKNKASMEKAIAARKEFKKSESDFKMTNFTSQAENKKGGWAMIGEKTINGKKWAVMERGLLDIYGKVLIEQSGYMRGEGEDYKDVVLQILESFRVE